MERHSYVNSKRKKETMGQTQGMVKETICLCQSMSRFIIVAFIVFPLYSYLKSEVIQSCLTLLQPHGL